MILIALFPLFLNFMTLVVADKYLVAFGPETGSQMITLSSASEAMIERGHTITLLAAEAFVESIENTLPTKTYTMESFQSSTTKYTFQDFKRNMTGNALRGNFFKAMREISSVLPELLESLCNDMFRDTALLNRLTDRKIDLVLAHAVFACPILIAQYLDVPFVAITPAIPPSMHIRHFCNPVNPAFNPELPTGYSDRMTFSERVKNTLISALQWMVSDVPMRGFDKIKRKYNIKPEISTFESFSKAEIWFITSHFCLDFPRPYQPNTISVGGITAKPSKPLPKDLEDFMQSSKDDGVIVFSMGSFINSMETSMADMFAKAFAKLPHKIVWKSAGNRPSKIPPNVKIAEWLPQNDILAHPKTRAMIYHCGVNGVFEAIYHAVPVICIPVFADQWDNAQRLKVKGVSRQLELLTMTSDDLVEAVKNIIEDKSFQTNMIRLSAIFHDEHLPAPERLVYWMEKVVRHGGAGHLRTSAFELNVIQYNLLDVKAFLGFCVFFVAYVCYLLCRLLLRCCCKARKKQKSE